MNDRTESATRDEVTPEQMHTALFAQLVMQQTNLAMMLMGKVPHPESGEVTRDVDAARLFIDQLEMLEVKTKGNLTRDEAALLKQSLMNLRLTFVDAVESPAEKQPSPTASPEQPAPAKPAEEEHPKKFSKKY